MISSRTIRYGTYSASNMSTSEVSTGMFLSLVLFYDSLMEIYFLLRTLIAGMMEGLVADVQRAHGFASPRSLGTLPPMITWT